MSAPNTTQVSRTACGAPYLSFGTCLPGSNASRETVQISFQTRRTALHVLGIRDVTHTDVGRTFSEGQRAGIRADSSVAPGSPYNACRSLIHTLIRPLFLVNPVLFIPVSLFPFHFILPRPRSRTHVMTASAASTMPNYTGCIVDGRYELVRILGSGTYGVVYHAVDTRPSPGPTGNNASRAVKMIRKAGRKPSELAAARREIALHRLVSDHPSIITVHDAYEDDDYFYIVMDLCRGGDLFEPICKRVYVDNDALLRKAFVSLIDAVEACHSSRVYHRDLKPENILVSEDRSEIYLADFGMATNRSMVEDFYCGTAAYMSPGMSSARDVFASGTDRSLQECIGHLSGYKAYLTAYSDVWALGVIFVNMISGRNPWERATLDDPCFIQFIENPDFLFDVLPISEGANEIIRRAFVLNPRERLTLPALRQAVLDLDTFFRYEDELSVIGGYTKSVAPTLGCPQPHANGGIDESANVLSGGSSDAGSVRDARSAVPVVPMGASCQPTLSVPEFPRFGSGSSESYSSSRASSPASSLIVTPEATAAPACLEDLEDSGMFACRDSALGSQIGLSSTEINV